ncbi:glycosyltransferase [Merismopedia glauca]|nr:glycosyltransferase [Merismopedia glauca]
MVIPYISSVYGGTSKVVKELTQSMSNLRAEIDIITTDANGFLKLNLPLRTWIKEDSYKVQYFPCWHKYDFIISFYLIKWLFKNIKNYDLIHINTLFSPVVLLTYWVCQIFQIPYVVTPHGMLEPWALSYKRWKKQLYFNLLEKPSLKQATAIHLLASSEANNVKLMGLSHPVIIPNGIHCQEFEKLPDPDIFYQEFPQTRNKSLILFLGRIDPKKGLDLLAPAFATVHQQFPNTHLVIAGPDSIGFLPTVQNYFTEVGCLDAVTFTGMLGGALKLAALAAASIYVAPSYSEGFSMSVLEGMASGLPCVITTGCNFPEAERARAAYIVNIEAEAIANALIECLSHPLEAKAMGDRARQLVLGKYTWEQSAIKMIQVYDAIIQQQPIPTLES